MLIITALHALRLANTIAWWDFLADLPEISPPYLALTGLVWSLVGLVVLLGLWLGFTWASNVTRISALFFSAYYWLDRSLVASNPANQVNLVFMAVMNGLFLVFIFWIFTRPAVKAFFAAHNN